MKRELETGVDIKQQVDFLSIEPDHALEPGE